MASDLERDGQPGALRPAGSGEVLVIQAERSDAAPRPAGANHADRVVAALVHDLNNLLTVVLGSLEQLRRQPLDGRGQQQLERAQRATWRAGQLAQEVLTAAAAGGGAVEIETAPGRGTRGHCKKVTTAYARPERIENSPFRRACWAVQNLVERGLAHLHPCGSLAHRLPGREVGLGPCQLVQCHDGPAPALPAAGLGRLQPGAGALADKVAFELRQRPEDVEHQCATRRGGVDRLGERAEPYPAPLQRRDGLDQVRHGAPEPVEMGYSGVREIE